MDLSNLIKSPLISKALGGITKYIEELRDNEKNTQNFPIQIIVQNRPNPKGKVKTFIDFVCVDMQNKKFYQLESFTSTSILTKNPMLGAIAPMIKNMLNKLEEENQTSVYMSLNNRYDKEEPYTAIDFVDAKQGIIIQSISLSEVSNSVDQLKKNNG